MTAPFPPSLPLARSPSHACAPVPKQMLTADGSAGEVDERRGDVPDYYVEETSGKGADYYMEEATARDKDYDAEYYVTEDE